MVNNQNGVRSKLGSEINFIYLENLRNSFWYGDGDGRNVSFYRFRDGCGKITCGSGDGFGRGSAVGYWNKALIIGENIYYGHSKD